MVLGVNLADDRDDAVAFLKNHGITYPNVVDTATVAGSFGVTAIPETYFLDTRGRVVSVNRGFELEVDKRRGMLLRQAIFPADLDRRVQGLFATRWTPPDRPTKSSAPTTSSAAAGTARGLAAHSPRSARSATRPDPAQQLEATTWADRDRLALARDRTAPGLDLESAVTS